MDRERDASVYIHFPWCLRKCPYCDFATSKIAKEDIPQRTYTDAVLRDLSDHAPQMAPLRLRSVFFGGGTPSLWEPQDMARVLQAIRAAFGDEAEDLEVTAECNPSSLDHRTAEGFRNAGINRLSIGVQSLDDRELQYLGRLHDAKGAKGAVSLACETFEHVSADLMFGLPGQTTGMVTRYVEQLVDLGVEHLSAYALTIEPGTQFGELHRKGRLTIAPDDDYAEIFLHVEGCLERMGFEHYEVSNYALPGAHSRHNLHYWQAGSYFGLGAAGVGALLSPGGGFRWRNQPDASKYMAARDRNERFVEREDLPPETRLREAIMLGLRTKEGLDLEAMALWTGLDPRTARKTEIERGIDAGDLLLAGSRLSVPRPRWLVLDRIVTDLF
ncbi:MAG: radical SAM family heme chaperone HemW [Myxococcales bacterium]|nr:radical SAM family heme chaperone HemW [Myxococcales bacterium]